MPEDLLTLIVAILKKKKQDLNAIKLENTNCLAYIEKTKRMSMDDTISIQMNIYSNDYRGKAIERFSNDCRKTITNVITPTNHNRSKQRGEPIRIPSN